MQSGACSASAGEPDSQSRIAEQQAVAPCELPGRHARLKPQQPARSDDLLWTYGVLPKMCRDSFNFERVSAADMIGRLDDGGVPSHPAEERNPPHSSAPNF